MTETPRTLVSDDDTREQLLAEVARMLEEDPLAPVPTRAHVAVLAQALSDLQLERDTYVDLYHGTHAALLLHCTKGSVLP
jgi:hypothetical protein